MLPDGAAAMSKAGSLSKIMVAPRYAMSREQNLYCGQLLMLTRGGLSGDEVAMLVLLIGLNTVLARARRAGVEA